MVQFTQKNLSSIKKLAQISQERFTDKRYGEFFSRMITKEIEKTDLLLDRLKDYVRVTTPIPRTGTVQRLIEELLKKHGVRFSDRRIQLTKKLEKDLPETMIPDEPLRYLIDSLLQYSVIAVPAGGSIELSATREEKYIEVSAALTGVRKAEDDRKDPYPISIAQTEGVLNLELRLMEEILERNRGEMKCKANESEARALISFKLPVERRKVVCYPSKEPG